MHFINTDVIPTHGTKFGLLKMWYVCWQNISTRGKQHEEGNTGQGF